MRVKSTFVTVKKRRKHWFLYLLAIAREGRCVNVLSGDFASKYRLSSVSSVNSAVKGLMDRNLLMVDQGVYSVYDKFLAAWLTR